MRSNPTHQIFFIFQPERFYDMIEISRLNSLALTVTVNAMDVLSELVENNVILCLFSPQRQLSTV